MQKDTFELQVLVNGRPVREAYFQGRAFIEARKGTQYTLKLKNNSHRRAVAVFSVDGIDVLHGKKAGETDGGYIVDSYSSIEIKGFRVDDNTVSGFKFDYKRNSYANKIGAKNNGVMEKGTENCGVIGVRVTFEKSVSYIKNFPIPYRDGHPEIYPSYPWNTTNYPTITFSSLNSVSGGCIGSFGITRSLNCSTNMDTMRASNSLKSSDEATYACCVSDLTPDLSMGTAWGEKIEDSVKTVSFDKSDETTELTIFYGEREDLEKYGVDFSPVKKVATWPSAFGTKYCPIP